MVLWNQASIYNDSEIFDGECGTMVDMTFNDRYAKIKVIHFGTNRFLIYNICCQ